MIPASRANRVACWAMLMFSTFLIWHLARMLYGSWANIVKVVTDI